MLYVEEYIQNSIDAKQKHLAIKISKELCDFLNVLDKDGLLREKLSGSILEKRHIIVEAQKNNDAIIATFNKFYQFYLTDKREVYLEFMRSNGFTDIDLMHLLHSQMIFNFLANMEMIKNLFSFILKDSSSADTLGSLFGKKGIACSHGGRLVAQRLDVKLRNALSHFTFNEDGKYICYYEYKRKGQTILPNEGKILSADLLGKTIEVSLLKALLGCLIADWYNLTPL
jgi:hypothetical protein